MTAPGTACKACFAESGCVDLSGRVRSTDSNECGEDASAFGGRLVSDGIVGDAEQQITNLTSYVEMRKRPGTHGRKLRRRFDWDAGGQALVYQSHAG